MEVRYPLPHKRGTSAILARYSLKTRRNACDTPLCATTSRRVLRDMLGLSHIRLLRVGLSKCLRLSSSVAHIIARSCPCEGPMEFASVCQITDPWKYRPVQFDYTCLSELSGIVSCDAAAIRIGFESCDANGPRNVKNTNIAKHRAFFFSPCSLLVVRNRSWKCLNEGNFTLRCVWQENAAIRVLKLH